MPLIDVNRIVIEEIDKTTLDVVQGGKHFSFNCNSSVNMNFLYDGNSEKTYRNEDVIIMHNTELPIIYGVDFDINIFEFYLGFLEMINGGDYNDGTNNTKNLFNVGYDTISYTSTNITNVSMEHDIVAKSYADEYRYYVGGSTYKQNDQSPIVGYTSPVGGNLSYPADIYQENADIFEAYRSGAFTTENVFMDYYREQISPTLEHVPSGDNTIYAAQQVPQPHIRRPDSNSVFGSMVWNALTLNREIINSVAGIEYNFVFYITSGVGRLSYHLDWYDVINGKNGSSINPAIFRYHITLNPDAYKYTGSSTAYQQFMEDDIYTLETGNLLTSGTILSAWILYNNSLVTGRKKKHLRREYKYTYAQSGIPLRLTYTVYAVGEPNMADSDRVLTGHISFAHVSPSKEPVNETLATMAPVSNIQEYEQIIDKYNYGGSESDLDLGEYKSPAGITGNNQKLFRTTLYVDEYIGASKNGMLKIVMPVCYADPINFSVGQQFSDYNISIHSRDDIVNNKSSVYIKHVEDYED